MVYRHIKSKAVPQHTYGDEGGERIYSSYSITTSALDGGEWSASRPGHVPPPHPPRKGPPVPVGPEAEWTPELVYIQTLQEIPFASAGDRNWIARSFSPQPIHWPISNTASYPVSYLCEVTGKLYWVFFRGFPQPLHTNVWIVTFKKPGTSPSNYYVIPTHNYHIR
jgi:hypothetical protein